MAYRHYGNIGDIWKHLSLCDIVSGEEVKTYVETNSAYFDYKLENTPGQQYGIGHFSRKAASNKKLRESEYFRVISPYLSKGRYPGSFAQVISILNGKDCNYICFDTDRTALESLRANAAQLDISGRLDTRNTDSIGGFLKLVPELDEKSFVHIDPYLINQEDDNGDTYLKGFLKAAQKGIMCLMWYGFMTLREKKKLNRLIGKETIRVKGRKISCTEIILRSIMENSVPFSPGIMGCGILTANLHNISINKISEHADLLVNIYSGAVFTDKDSIAHSGEVYVDKILQE